MKNNLTILVGLNSKKVTERLKHTLEQMDGWSIKVIKSKHLSELPHDIVISTPDAVFLDSGSNIDYCLANTKRVLEPERNPLFFFLADDNSDSEIIDAFRKGISDYIYINSIQASSLSNLLKFNFEKKSYNIYKQNEIKRFRTIFEQTSDGIVLLDYKTLQFIEFNDSASESLGYSQEEFSKLLLSDIELFKSKEEIQAECRKIVERKNEIYTICLATKEKDVLEVVVNARAIQLNGRTYLQCLWHDVTEYQRCLNNYKRAMANLETALNELSLKSETVKVQKELLRQKNLELMNLQDLQAGRKRSKQIDENLRKYAPNKVKTGEDKIPPINEVQTFLTGRRKTDRGREIEIQEKSVLLVENNPETTHFIMNICQESGFKVIISRNGRSALFLASYYRPNGIITNTNISQVFGSSALHRITQNMETCKIPLFLADLDQNMHYLSHFEVDINKFLLEIGSRKNNNLMEPDYKSILRNKRILIADDNTGYVAALKSYLKEMNAEVFICRDGAETVKFINEKNKIDLVLMDMMMPVISGYEVIVQVRKQKAYSRLPIIALTSKGMAEDYDKCLSTGATDCLSKPIHMTKLSIMLSAWLQ